jgi:hypothetical protein
MKRNKKSVLVAILAICALAAGGAAFTADVSGSPDTAVAGFHQTSISGAEASSVVWNLSADGQYVDSVVMHLTSDGTTALPAGDAVNVGFDQTALNGTPSSPDVSTPCTEDGVDATKWTCTPTSDTVTVQEANLFNVSVTDNTVAKVS